MKLAKFFIVILAVNSLFAQQNTTARIKSVSQNGLYKIVLPPEIRSFSREDLSDFRILDSKGTEIPYFVIQDNNQQVSSSFSECKLISKTVIPKKKTTLIFENPKASIDEIVISIANSDVVKPYSISGSNDQKEWFGLINDAQLYNLESALETSVFKTIKLPLSSYRYLKIDFDNRKTLAINVLKIGFFTNKIKNNAVQQILPKNIHTKQLPSQKKTLIRVAFDNTQIVNQLVFDIKNPDLFKRKARMYRTKTKTVKHKTAIVKEMLYEFELSSDSKNEINIPQLFEKDFFVEIENQDNPPLSIAKINCFQNQVSVIANLKANEKYIVKTGNPKSNPPQYDLENFKSKIANVLPEATIYKIEHSNFGNHKTKNKSVWQQPWFMWLCIGLGTIAVVYFTIHLIKDLNNKS